MDKVFADTSIIVRFFVDGDKKLLDLFEINREVHIPLPILFETVFVLEKIYKIPRHSIVSQISNLLIQKNAVTDGLAREIMSLYKNEQSLSIVDCFAVAYCKRFGLRLETYDKALSKILKILKID